MKNFAITGVAGFVAPRHLKAIKDTGNRLVAALDPHDSVGRLDQYFDDVAYFREFERFDRHVDRLRRSPDRRVDILSICSPNYLHDPHIRLGLRLGADVICEKPLVLHPQNLDALEELERETGKRIYTLLQLRVHPALMALRQQILTASRDTPYDVCLTYITPRGLWYHFSWKGDVEKSGGVITNIGIHLFDLLIWLFGPASASELHSLSRERASGVLTLSRARVTWFLSVDKNDLPDAGAEGNRTTFRELSVDGTAVEFSDGFTDLHTRVYEATLAGDGFGISEARPAIELVHDLRSKEPRFDEAAAHPFLRRAGLLR